VIAVDPQQWSAFAEKNTHITAYYGVLAFDYNAIPVNTEIFTATSDDMTTRQRGHLIVNTVASL